jgi:hypothetical protein
MQTALEKARALLAGGSVPRRYWDYAVQMAANIIQRSPNSTNEKTSYEVLMGEATDVSRLIPFYAPGVYYSSH